MDATREAIERGLTLYQELVGEEQQLTQEFEKSQEGFFAAGTADRSDSSMASRRRRKASSCRPGLLPSMRNSPKRL